MASPIGRRRREWVVEGLLGTSCLSISSVGGHGDEVMCVGVCIEEW